MQALWRWLWLGSHNILKPHRPTLLRLFRKVMYARTRAAYNSWKEALESEPLREKYPQFWDHLDDSYFTREQMWATCIRIESKWPTNGVDTNNYVECSFRLGYFD